jgi:hypothetical protein
MIRLMSDLKFSCPSCGQHIQCDEAHAGENIPCPACAVLVRVPAAAAIVEPAIPTTAANPFEEKVSYTPTGSIDSGPEKVPTLEENISPKANAPAGDAGAPASTEREHQIAEARAHRPIEVATTVKPRLSFVLSGGQAPAPEENDSAVTPEQKEKLKPSDIKTVKE